MTNVGFIEINVNQIGKELKILIDLEKERLTTNNKVKSISKNKIEDFFRIIRNWKSDYPLSKNIDGEKFTIKIISIGKSNHIRGNGTYPDNYIEFKRWVDDVNA